MEPKSLTELVEADYSIENFKTAIALMDEGTVRDLKVLLDLKINKRELDPSLIEKLEIVDQCLQKNSGTRK